MQPEVLSAVLMAPSRYDEKGVLVFRFGINQNGSLSTLAGLVKDYNRRHEGRREIRCEIFDEHVREPVTAKLLEAWRDEAASRGERFVLLLCGVQTPTYPRARDVALTAKSLGIDVLAGGVHLSCHGPSVEFLARSGVSVGIGEVEPIWDEVMEDAFSGTLRPLYRLDAAQGVRVKTAVEDITATDLPTAPFPDMPRRYLGSYLNPRHHYIDTSRGCPYVCTFCAVKNTFGRTMRSRDPDALVAWMTERVENGDADWFTFTDDNFVRNPLHLEVLEGLAKARERGTDISVALILDVEASCYAREDSKRGERTRHFLEMCQKAGVSNVFIGLDSTNDAALREMKKNQNRDRGAKPEDVHRAILERYRVAVRAWQEIGASVECGYILGFDADGVGAGKQAADDMVAIGVDIVTFYLLTPLPGAEDYARALQQGTLLETDFNEYFRNRTMVGHPVLAPEELDAELAGAVRSYFSWPRVVARLARGLFG
ncbi:MAG: B12-binding domain-containing radical SAM protein, partial [Myxococcota bacterium]